MRIVGDIVAVDDTGAVEGDVGRTVRRGADGDDDFVGTVLMRLARIDAHADAVGVKEAGPAGDGLDAIAGELVFEHFDFVVERHAQAGAEVLALDVLLDPIGQAVKAALAPAGQVEHGLAQGLARDGAGVDRDAA